MYYAGSNGKHSGSKPHRNASLGLATLKIDGVAGLRGSGTVTSLPVLCTGRPMLLTMDGFGQSGSYVSVDVNGLDLSVHVGNLVVLELELKHAIVYTIGFL